MKIICNGEEQEVASGATLARLIAGFGLKAANVVAEYNGRIIKPEEYENCLLEDGAVLELIRFVGGG